MAQFLEHDNITYDLQASFDIIPTHALLFLVWISGFVCYIAVVIVLHQLNFLPFMLIKS